MEADIPMTAVKNVVRISTNEGVACKHCDESIGLERFEASVNHYIEQHGYQLLHVGTESSEGANGKLWHHTVAVLGNSKGARPRPPKKTLRQLKEQVGRK